jgi:uncharacterized protein (DUF305 family)
MKSLQPLMISLALLAGWPAGQALAQSKPSDPHAGHSAAAKGAGASAAKTPGAASNAAFEAANARMHKDMAVPLTGDADRDFLASMIPHHQGAIDMAQVVLKHGKDPKVRKLAQDIIDAQQKEIATMKAWLKARTPG